MPHVYIIFGDSSNFFGPQSFSVTRLRGNAAFAGDIFI